MAVKVGHLAQSPSGGVFAPLSTSLEAYAVDYWPPYQSEVPQPLYGPYTSNLPVSTIAVAKVGYRAPGFFDDFYNRVHFTPSPIALGSILSDKELPLGVWNAFLIPKTLSSLEIDPSAGVTFEPPLGVTLPAVMAPLQEIVFTMKASQGQGTPVLNTPVTVVVDGLTYGTPLTGTRLTLFPFPPNWNNNYDETFVYSGWVLPAADGSEQTGSKWGNQPRRQFDYTILVHGTHMQLLENMLFGWHHRLFGVPHWADMSTLTAPAAQAATMIAVDTTDRSYEVGGIAVIYSDVEDFEAFQVKEMSAGTITLSSPLARAWPQGTRVYPVSSALIAESISGVHHSDNTIVMPVSFECEPSMSPVNNPIGGEVPTYRGEELYLGPLNWAAALSFQYLTDREKVDYNTGRFQSYSQQGFSKPMRKHNWQVRTRAEGRDFRAWLGRREGVARPVYMSTGKTDLTIIGAVEAADITLDVEGNGYASLVGGASAKRDIIIHLRDGAPLLFRILSAQQLVDGAVRLFLDNPVGQDLTAAQIKRVSFLHLYRLDNNSTTIRWVTDRVGVVEANLRVKTTTD